MWCRVSACVQCENGVIASPVLLVEGPGDASFTAGDGRMGVEALKVVGPVLESMAEEACGGVCDRQAPETMPECGQACQTDLPVVAVQG